MKASLRQLFQKLEVHTRAQLVKIALEQYKDQFLGYPKGLQYPLRGPGVEGERELVLMPLGLGAVFTKQLSDVKGISTINARAEGIEKSRIWRERSKNVVASCPQTDITSGNTSTTRPRSHTHSRCGMTLFLLSRVGGTPGKSPV